MSEDDALCQLSDGSVMTRAELRAKIKAGLAAWKSEIDTSFPSFDTVGDSNVDAVRELLKTRAEIGLQKYGVTTERKDLSRIDWLKHAQAEALDLAVYLQRLISEEDNK